ncbi:hypothetical protein QYE76_039229 [Lolium multiflorum]|uniref:DUF4283 domain-containing protein n=1 Tax=Lolium multiflorum TaxID=4521 RepID=A0AAD8T9I0_LOLMU|nr:hypothetical protein QYE76_039229 [Lolium multiflorum]
MATDWNLATPTTPALEVPEIPLLSVGLQAISLSDQGQNQENKEEEKEEFTLLLKVACSGGTPKILSLSSVQQAMTKAWRNNFYRVSQVNQFVFRAHFSTFEAMMFVFTRQPWTVGSDVMLIELESPGKEIEKGDYKFEFVYATVRAYGIPKKHRSFKILKDILNLVGTQSEFHELRQVMLESRPDYIWGIAKLKVGMPIYDRVKLLYSVNEAGITYLNYEKIGRICVFCGVMFHTVGNCNLRQKIVADKIRSGQADQAQQVPFQRYGSWIVEPADIPINFVVQGEGSSPVLSSYQSPHIGRFQRAHKANQLKQRVDQDSNGAMTRRRLQFGEQSSAKEQEQQLQDRTVHPPRSVNGGNQTQSGAPITAELHGGHVASAGKGVLENNPGGKEKSGGQGTVRQQGQLSPSDSLALSSLPYPLEEEALILENLGCTAGHSHQQEHMRVPYLGKEPLQVPNTYQIPQATPPANLQSAMDSSAQMLPGASPNSHHHSQNDPATPFSNPQLLSPAKSPPKRSSTSLDFFSSPAAKRATPASNQDGGGGDGNLQAVQVSPGGATAAQGQIFFSQMKPPAIGVGPSLAAQLEEGGGSGAVSTEIQGISDIRGGGGILGAGPSFSNKSRSNLNPTLSAARSRNRRRPSGWDVEEDANAGIGHGIVGVTHHKPGASTWRRVRRAEEMAMGNASGRGGGQALGISGVPNAVSNCPSPALSSSTDRADHDPWPLHTPSPSHSIATQDTQQGVFSPPAMASEYYVGVDGCFGSDATRSQANVQGKIQLGTSCNDAAQTVCEDSGRASMEMDLEAAAPALKASRAP